MRLPRRLTPQKREFCDLLTQGFGDTSDELIQLRPGRHVARAARSGLFKDDRIDPVIGIRWKDIYEALEDAVDACDTAANRIGNVLVKNA